MDIIKSSHMYKILLIYLIWVLNECFKHHPMIPEGMDKEMSSTDLNKMGEKNIYTIFSNFKSNVLVVMRVKS